MFDKNAFEYLVGLGGTEIINVNEQNYSTKQMFHVKLPTPAPLKTTTLTSLVDYIKSGLDLTTDVIVHVASPSEVRVLSDLQSDSGRHCFMVCEAMLPTNVNMNRYIDSESFNVMLQSSFVENDDKAIMLKITGCIQEKDVKETSDDGVSQAVTIKTGVAKVGDVLVPNPVVLAPYRTFPEVSQPESKFIFRMKEGPTAALFEADGGAWRNEAMDSIAEYLKAALHDRTFVRVIY